MPFAANLDSTCLDACLVGHALDGMCVGMVLTNALGRVAWMNRSAEALLGMNRDDARGKPLGQSLRDPSMIEFWNRAYQSDGILLGEVGVQIPAPHELKVNASRCEDHDGGCIGRALLFCDVTADRFVRIDLSQQAAERLMRMTGSWDGDGTPHAQLTGQELRVLRLLGRGLSNALIADEIGVAPSTVRSHLKHLYAKLRVTSRADAIRYAVHHGLE